MRPESSIFTLVEIASEVAITTSFQIAFESNSLSTRVPIRTVPRIVAQQASGVTAFSSASMVRSSEANFRWSHFNAS